mgnify:FL=1
MPKQTYKIQGFHGGINSDADPRDIQEIETPNIVDANIDSVGRVKTIGRAGGVSASFANAPVANSGLFVMGSDKQLDGGDGDETLIFNYDSGGTNIDANDSEGWDAGVINFSDAATPVYYSADGVLRVGDSAFNRNNQWFGYIKDERFNGLTADSDAIGWYNADQNLAKPTSGKCLISTPSANHLDSSGVNGPNQEYKVVSATGSAIHHVIEASSVNLRVGLQLKGMIRGMGGKVDWNVQRGLNVNQELKTHKPYPFCGFNLLCLANGTDEVFNYMHCTMNINNNYTIISDESYIVHPFFISSGRDYDDFRKIEIKWGTNDSTSDEEYIYYTWKFRKEDIQPDCWNLLVLTPSNFDDVLDPEVELNFGDSYDFCEMKVFRLESNASSNESLDWRMSAPLRIENPGIVGYPPGTYTFHYSWLYDKEKQESLPFKFNDVDSVENFSNHAGGDNSATRYTQTGSDADYIADDFIGRKLQNKTDSSEGYISDNTTTTIDVHDLLHGTDNDFDNNDDVRIKQSTTNKINVVGGYVLFNFDIYNSVNTNDSYSINKRITGSRLYWKLEDKEDYFLIGEQDYIENGFKWFPSEDKLSYDMQNPLDTSDHYVQYSALIKGVSPESANMIDTYRNINGYPVSVGSINAQYKTAVIQGRRAYIGNIKQDGDTHPDRIIKSQINKFDTFPKDRNSIDVAIRDGDSIVKLEAFADRILEFKKNSLYIINVAANVDFLEDVYRNKGCSFDYHVTKTDYGISWFNVHGVYFYDGKNVSNLLEKNGMRLISESDWGTFIKDGTDDTDMSSAHIGYMPKKRQILINNENTDVFIYDFILRAWMKGAGKVPVTTARTNFALNANQDLFYIDNTNTTVQTFDPEPNATSNSAFVFQTRDIDFGEPAIRKKIYKVYVTYKTGGTTNVQVKYDTNGTTTFDKVFQDGDNLTSNELDNAGSNQWVQATLKPNTSTEANSIYSFALKFESDGTVPSTFEINDICVVYRMKNIK